MPHFFLYTFVVFWLMGCYSPEQMVVNPDIQSSSSQQGGSGAVYPINTGMQICNPSTSLDTVHYPASMLWLGFSGNLVVKNPPKNYSTTRAIQHDRLTISNYDNTVAWFLLMDSVPSITCEFQDPEWSTHPHWIVSMGATTEHNDCANEDYLYSGYLLRPMDNSRLRFNDQTLDYISTPHAWIGTEITGPDTPQIQDSVTYMKNGFADKTSIQKFLGSDQMVVTWSKQEQGYTIHYIDYRQASPQEQRLAKPEGREDWKAESALISPDGNWVVYNLYERLDSYESYLQELRPHSKPVLIAKGAMDPHWWVHPEDGRLFVVYIEVATGLNYILTQDLQKPDVEKSVTAGTTQMQEVQLYADRPLDIAVEWVGAPKTIAHLPFRAGRSPDGRWLGTGTNYGYMLELP